MNVPRGVRPLRRRDADGRVVALYPPSAEQQADIAARAALAEAAARARGFDFGERAALEGAGGPAPAAAPAPAPQHPAEGLDVSAYRLDVLTAGAPAAQAFTLAPLFPLGTVGLLFGPGGVGKSMLALDLCMGVARRAMQPAGGNLDFVAGPLGGSIPAEAGGAVVFITLEDPAGEVHRRRASLDPDMTCAGAPIYVIPALDIPGFEAAMIRPADTGRRAVPGDFADGIKSLLGRIERASRKKIRLLVLDPAGDFLDGDENDAQFVKALMRQLRELAASWGCTIILLGHVPKGDSKDDGAPTMRGSGAWIANSRAAYALWPPSAEKAAQLARKVGCTARALVWGCLVKANHAGAPVNWRRLFRRDQVGRLLDVTAASGEPMDDTWLMDALVDACRIAAKAGKPFQKTGIGGLFNDRADLPASLMGMSKQAIDDLAQAALDCGRLVKASGMAGGAPKWLDAPDGPLARGHWQPPVAGSRADAIARMTAGG